MVANNTSSGGELLSTLVGGFNGVADQLPSQTELLSETPDWFQSIQSWFSAYQQDGLMGLFNAVAGTNFENPLTAIKNDLMQQFGLAAPPSPSQTATPDASQNFKGLTPVTHDTTNTSVSSSYEAQTRQALVTQARSHLGRLEVGGDNTGIEDITNEFNKRPWCASFLTKQVGEILPNTISGASSLGIKAQAEQAGAFEEAGNGYIPQPGDIMVKDRGTAYDNKGHVGMVASVDVENGTYTTIEGNVDMGHASGRDGVREITRSLDELQKDRVFGFVNTVEASVARNGVTPEMQVETQVALNGSSATVSALTS